MVVYIFDFFAELKQHNRDAYGSDECYHSRNDRHYSSAAEQRLYQVCNLRADAFCAFGYCVRYGFNKQIIGNVVDECKHSGDYHYNRRKNARFHSRNAFVLIDSPPHIESLLYRSVANTLEDKAYDAGKHTENIKRKYPYYDIADKPQYGKHKLNNVRNSDELNSRCIERLFSAVCKYEPKAYRHKQ